MVNPPVPVATAVPPPLCRVDDRELFLGISCLLHQGYAQCIEDRDDRKDACGRQHVERISLAFNLHLQQVVAPLASAESLFSVTAIVITFFLLSEGSSWTSSFVPPPLETRNMTSPPWTLSHGSVHRIGGIEIE
jgi:hypothetical protein